MLKAVAIFFVISATAGAAPSCKIDSQLRDEIRSYQPVVDKIISAVINGPRSGLLYEDLAEFVDTFGGRLSGSDALENAIDNVLVRQQAANLTTSTHNVMIPRWVRGEESASLVQPRAQKLTIIGLGNIASTPKEGITAEVLIVTSFDDLKAKAKQVPGKIVLFNVPFTTYGQTAQYRNRGALEASKLGAVASLVRSINPFSLDSPHTGDCEFDDPKLRIPAAAISLEGANFLARLAARGLKIVVNLNLQSSLEPDRLSRNAIGDIVGKTKPNEYVVISGHIDSWDPAQGAQDDAGGAFLAWHSLALINALGLPPPARTLRSILWTAEEAGLIGANAYRKEREDEARNWTIAFESDTGTFKALGIGFAGTDEAACIIEEIASLFGAANGTAVERQQSAGSDIESFSDLGIPLAEPYMVPNDYFWYHHSKADWVDAIKPEDLDQNLAIMASAIYILADLSVSLPKAPIKTHPIVRGTAQPLTSASSAGLPVFHNHFMILVALLFTLKITHHFF